ncbi:MAG: chorismate mutase [Oscillospiraceae bacterium]|nr:chorismate mutase [Oscillospiraceae bacterium]
MNLDELRGSINRLDRTIQDAFSERMEVCREVARYKQAQGMQIFQTDREKEILDRIRQDAPTGLESPSALLFQTIMDISKHLQYREIHQEHTPYEFKPLGISADSVVACQGTAGANAETAAKQIFGADCQPQFLLTFADVFDAVQSGQVQYGILPVVNSTFGSVVQAYDLMAEHHFYICRTTVVEITNCLAVRPGTKLADVKKAYSHPQALAQCGHFLTRSGITPCEYSNTATAARMVAQSDEPIAAVCSENCAALHGLEILAHGISDHVPNFTRFICISKELQLSEDADRISVMLRLPHEEGSLYRLLSKFVICGLNLLKLESRPIRNGSFEVLFYLDFNGNICDPSVRALLSDLSENLEYFKFLGNYGETSAAV